VLNHPIRGLCRDFERFMQEQLEHRNSRSRAQIRQDDYKPVIGADNVLRYVRRSPLEILKARLQRAGSTQPSQPVPVTALDVLARSARKQAQQTINREINITRDGDISERIAELKRQEYADSSLQLKPVPRTILDGKLQSTVPASHQEDDILPPLETDDDYLPPLVPIAAADLQAMCTCFACVRKDSPEIQQEIDATLKSIRAAERSDATEMDALLDLMELYVQCCNSSCVINSW
jgi:hypothetical protein